MAQALPLVHNIETTGRNALPESFQAYRAGFDIPNYRASGEFYWRVDKELGTDYLSKWDVCRERAYFCRHKDTGEVKVFSSACRLRWCSLCTNARRGFITHQVSEWIKTARYPKFLTLTLKHSNAPLAHQVDSLYNYFRKFRKAKMVKEGAIGGIWFFQIKRSKESGQWHPHIHCAIEGAYLPHNKLSKLWGNITYGSNIVDIRPIRDLERGAAEVARYASTPADLATTNPDDYVELFASLHGRRSCGTWGTAKGVSLRQPKADEADKWINIGSWTVVYAMQNREPAAELIIQAWLQNNPLPEYVTMSPDCRIEVEEHVKGILERSTPFLPNFYNTS